MLPALKTFVHESKFNRSTLFRSRGSIIVPMSRLCFSLPTLYSPLSSTPPFHQRFFVLSESSSDFCVLKIFYEVTEASWGFVPLKMKASIPIAAMQSVACVSAKIKKGLALHTIPI